MGQVEELAEKLPQHLYSKNARDRRRIWRVVGTTSQSCNIRLLLSSVCWQIASVYGRDAVNLPTDYPSLVAHFHRLLAVSFTVLSLRLNCSLRNGVDKENEHTN